MDRLLDVVCGILFGTTFPSPPAVIEEGLENAFFFKVERARGGMEEEDDTGCPVRLIASF